MKITKPEQLKHGMRVKCKINGTEIKDARLSFQGSSVYICQDVESGANDAIEQFDYKYSWYLGNIQSLIGHFSIERLQPDWDTLSEGDILVDKSGDEIMILGIVGRVYFVSCDNDFENLSSIHFTLKGLKRFYSIKQPEETEIKELTLEEVAEKFKIPVDKIRIKD